MDTVFFSHFKEPVVVAVIDVSPDMVVHFWPKLGQARMSNPKFGANSVVTIPGYSVYLVFQHSVIRNIVGVVVLILCKKCNRFAPQKFFPFDSWTDTW